MKEFATRQLLGTGKKGILLRCIAEAFVLLVVFYLIAILIAMGLDNSVGAILGVKLDPMQHLDEYILLSGIIIMMGLVAGIVPALFAIRHNPVQVIKGEERFKDKMFLSKAFVCFEGVLSIYLNIRNASWSPFSNMREEVVGIKHHWGCNRRVHNELQVAHLHEAAILCREIHNRNLQDIKQLLPCCRDCAGCIVERKNGI